MPIAKQRASSSRLSLIASSAVAMPAGCEATTAGSMPQRWFDEEIGYIGDMPACTRIPTDTHRQ
ncbi:hypothetical protein LMG28614_04812 [Paraburkholderia ultramafica]|uniref:Uncharacterized protein n=1 Tax=Paraburkholderia ultramafica TaxID=1544867 RepID=A0A6S7BH89_9BURK|nr:hypothetical protein LMG28614_04812 [Paraburkholderia ultramafica]